MQRILLFICFTLIVSLSASLAQPTFYFHPATQVAQQNQEICITLRVDDFTDILSSRFPIQWDQGVLQFVRIQNLNPAIPMLDMSDIDISQAAQGKIKIDWNNGLDCRTARTAVTVDDETDVFQICFKAIGIYGNHTYIEIPDIPFQNYVTRLNANCINIGMLMDKGFISIETPPLKVNISNADGFKNDIVCLDFKVEDFNKIVAFQFPMKWDSSILQFQNITTFALPDFTAKDNFGTAKTSSGILNVSWFQVNKTVTLPKGTRIFQVCFKVIGNCGQSSDVKIEAQPLSPVEVYNETSGSSSIGTHIGLLQQKGKVSVKCNNPNGITLNLENKNVCPGENFTVDIKAKDFSNIVELQFTLEWNPGIIQMITPRVTFPGGGNPCFSFENAVTVNSNQSGNGIITVNWKSFGLGCNLPNDRILMRLHFKAVGPSGSNATISVVNPILVKKFAVNDNVGINNNNGVVTLCDLPGLSMSASSIAANPGDTVCLSAATYDFNQITRMEYSLSWEPTVLAYLYMKDFDLVNLSSANFNSSLSHIGNIGVSWQNGVGISKPNGTTLYKACFKVIGDPGECSELSFGTTPYSVNIVTATSGGTNVGLIGQSGNVCTLNPLAFSTGFDQVISSSNTRVCLDAKVTNFKQLTRLKYSINWNPNVMKFSGITRTGVLPDFDSTSFKADSAMVANGQLIIDWKSASIITGTSVPNGSSIFKLCFDLTGPPEKCSPVSITNFPTNIEVTSAPTGGSNLGLTPNNGSICISGNLNLVNSVVTEIDCPTVKNGSIGLSVNGGSGTYDYTWTGPNVVQGVGSQANLGVGNYAVTVSDKFNPGLTLTKEFEVKYSLIAPVANAGPDTARQCGSLTIVLNGTRSTQGPNFTYSWKSITGGGLVIENENTLRPTVIGGLCYELTVTNISTGCFTRDTVCLINPEVPYVEAGPNQFLTCLKDTVTLDGSASSSGLSFTVKWTPGSGGQLVAGTENSHKAKAIKAGWYHLKLTNPSSGCASTDSVLVSLDKTVPVANAGLDSGISCTESFATLNGSGSSSGSRFTYKWTAIDGGSVCDNSDLINSKACSQGKYQLVVSDTFNGCFARDTVFIAGDTLKPIISAGTAKLLNCSIPTVILDGSISSPGNFNITWTPSAGIVSGQGTLKPVVNQGGLYSLSVENRANGCKSSAPVTVTQNIDTPLAVATASRAITCNVTDAELSSAGSSSGVGISYQWKNQAGTTISTAANFKVSTPGNYTLIVTNAQNGCTKSVNALVENKTTKPIANAGPDRVIGCSPASIFLNGITDADQTGLTIQWSGPLGLCIKNGNSLKPEISCSGQYIMTVFNVMTGCVNRDTVVVTNDKTPPNIDAGSDTTLTCTRTSVILQGTSDVSQATISWVSVPANLPISDPAILKPTVSKAGTYYLTVTSNTNGCSKTDLVRVTQDDAKPIANAGADDSITCIKLIGNLSAKGSSLNNTILTWTALSGSVSADQKNKVDITVPAGVYQLNVVNSANGCGSLDTAVVLDRKQLPLTDAGPDRTVGCTVDTLRVTGIGATGPGISYLWKDSAGKIIGNGLSVTVPNIGKYFLTIADSGTGCSATDSMVVTRKPETPPAKAQVDYDACFKDATLVGNLPPGTTGSWATTGNAFIERPVMAVSAARNLDWGINKFLWTLTIGKCISYSVDTVSVLVNRRRPDASDDKTVLKTGQGNQITLNVFQNDQLFNQSVYFKVLNQPQYGTLTSTANGAITLTKEKCQSGTLLIPYQVCSENCALMCDTAVVEIVLEPDPLSNCNDAPNAITPNGDGLNDELVFDVLVKNTPAAFPDNELIIFNRWGDIVYKAKPYFNDWKGTNNAGLELPHGTYYYILRLNLAAGNIIRGDITILR